MRRKEGKEGKEGKEERGVCGIGTVRPTSERGKSTNAPTRRAFLSFPPTPSPFRDLSRIMEKPTPLINSAMLPNYRGQVVRIIGKVHKVCVALAALARSKDGACTDACSPRSLADSLDGNSW